MPPRERFVTHSLQIIQGSGRVESDVDVVAVETEPVGSAVVIPNYLTASTSQLDTHQVQIWNRGSGPLSVTVEGGQINGGGDVVLLPGQYGVATSLPTTVPEYGMIVGDPP